MRPAKVFVVTSGKLKGARVYIYGCVYKMVTILSGGTNKYRTGYAYSYDTIEEHIKDRQLRE